MSTFLKMNKEINIEGLYTLYYFEHPKDFYYIGERHNFWELVYVDSGEIYAAADNNGYLLAQGNIIFHKPMEFHGITSVNNKRHSVLIITFETQSPSMDFFKNKIFSINSRQKKLLSYLLEEFKNALGTKFTNRKNEHISLTPEQKWSYQIGVGCLESFLLGLMLENTHVKRSKQVSSLAKKNVENALVDSIKEFLQNNIYQPLTLDDICRRFSMSKSYICQLFKNETGTSVIDYYINLKITEAKFLIRQGNLNFTQISETLGYTSLHHFTRIFKTKEKMSPSQYQKSIK